MPQRRGDTCRRECTNDADKVKGVGGACRAADSTVPMPVLVCTIANIENYVVRIGLY